MGNQCCHVLIRLNEPHQSNMAVHSKHTFNTVMRTHIYTRIYMHACNLHIWQMSQRDHSKCEHELLSTVKQKPLSHLRGLCELKDCIAAKSV